MTRDAVVEAEDVVDALPDAVHHVLQTLPLKRPAILLQVGILEALHCFEDEVACEQRLRRGLDRLLKQCTDVRKLIGRRLQDLGCGNVGILPCYLRGRSTSAVRDGRVGAKHNQERSEEGQAWEK